MPAIDPLLDALLTSGGSDLHLSAGSLPKMRLNGQVVPLQGWPEVVHDNLLAMLQEICPPARWAKFEHASDMDFAHDHGGKARFRCNCHRQQHGAAAVLRLIPTNIRTLADLATPPVVTSFAEYRSGLVLIAGPTGNGKSTTLAAIIDHINTRFARYIITIEEPVEFIHPMKRSTITQREVGADTPTFTDAIRSANRSDADVIMVGELRDLETIGAAVTSAETGALVFGTVHTNGAVKTIDRLVDTFPADSQDQIRAMLAVSLKAVCSQILVRLKDGSGRRATHEILVQNRAISNYIREAKTNQITQVMMSGRALGMQTLDDALEALLTEDLITGEEAYMKSIDKDRFRKAAGQPVV